MPNSRSGHGIGLTTFSLSVAVSFLMAISGCASKQGSWSSDAAAVAYTESTVDVTDRAPASMAIPADVEETLDNKNVAALADYHFTLGETFALEGNSTKAIEEYRLTLTYDPNSVQVRLRLASEYVKQGMVNEAIKHGKIAIEMDTKNVDAHMLLGGLYSSLHMYDDAMKEYEAVQKLDSQNYDAPMFVGALYAEQKKYSEAAARFEKLAKEAGNPNAHVAWYYLGRIRLEDNKDDVGGRAEHAFNQSIASKPSFADAVLSLGSLYEATGRKEKAVGLYANFQEKHGPNAVVAETLAQIYLEREEYEPALQQLAIIEAYDTEDLNAKVKISFILIQEKRYTEAIVKLEELLAKMPSAEKIRFYLGAVFEEVKDYKAAIPHFLKIPVGSPFFAESRVHASYLYKLVGDSDKSIEVIEAAIKDMPDHAPFYSLYASHLDDRHEYKKAVGMLKDAVVKFPESAQLMYFLGNMHDRLGDRENTISAMKKVLKIEAENVQAMNYLAYTFAETGVELESAEELARKASTLKPKDGYVLDTLGWVLFKKGQFEESVKVLEDAHRLQPNEAIIADHLGDAYYYFRMPERAKRLYEKAAALVDEEKAADTKEANGGNSSKSTGSESGSISSDKIRAKIVNIDRQSDSDRAKVSKERVPASAK